MSIAVSELRLSFIYYKIFPDLIIAPPAAPPMAFLGSADLYGQEFNRVQAEMQSYDRDSKLNDPLTLTPPWPPRGSNYKHRFWQPYLNNRKPQTLDGPSAWEYVVPFRINVPVTFQPEWNADNLYAPETAFIVDGLFYPHGVALVIMVRLLFRKNHVDNVRGVSLSFATKLAIELRHINLDVTLPATPPKKMKLGNAADQLLEYLAERCLGAQPSQSRWLDEPLSVATIIQGTGDPKTTVLPNTDLHRALHGLAVWDSKFNDLANLPAPTQQNLLIKDRFPNHLVYHLDKVNARVVWMPENFTAPPDPKHPEQAPHATSCYHRNLTLLWLQTAMLGQVAWLCRQERDAQGKLRDEMKPLALNASKRLIDLYATRKESVGGANVRYTYNSTTPRAYIDELGLVSDINAMLHDCGIAQDLSYVAH